LPASPLPDDQDSEAEQRFAWLRVGGRLVREGDLALAGHTISEVRHEAAQRQLTQEGWEVTARLELIEGVQDLIQHHVWVLSDRGEEKRGGGRC
jgi:hypothetical protein